MGGERGGAPAGEGEPGVCDQWRDGLWQDHTGEEGARFLRRRHLTAPPLSNLKLKPGRRVHGSL